MILNSIAAFKDHRDRILAAANGAPIVTTAPDLRVNYQEKCLATCPLAQHCRARLANAPVLLGDIARDLLGDSIPLPRLAALMSGTEAPQNDDEARLSADLRAAAGMGRISGGRRELLAAGLWLAASLPSARDVPYHSARPSRSAAIPLSRSVSVP